MKRALFLLLGLSLAGSLAVLMLARERLYTPSQAEDFAHLKRPVQASALWPAPEFSLTDHTGTPVSRASLAGHPWVANFVFTTCRTVCPLLTAKMVRLQRRLADVPEARFVSFSVDPEHDTVEALAAYARQWNPQEPRWHLLATTDGALEALARGFRVTAQRVDGGVDPILHSAVFVLVDARGIVRGVYDSEDAADFARLERELRALEGAAAPPPPKAARTGEVLYHELSCANCHERAELAPPLGGLLGQKRELDTRLLVTADEAYLRESILAPDAKRLAGYPLRMPTYEGHLTPAELTALVQYVTALPPPAAPAAAAEVALDPVCHMKVRVAPGALQLPHDGGTVYFCSEWCRSRFRESPDAYRR